MKSPYLCCFRELPVLSVLFLTNSTVITLNLWNHHSLVSQPRWEEAARLSNLTVKTEKQGPFPKNALSSEHWFGPALSIQHGQPCGKDLNKMVLLRPGGKTQACASKHFNLKQFESEFQSTRCFDDNQIKSTEQRGWEGSGRGGLFLSRDPDCVGGCTHVLGPGLLERNSHS